MTLKPNHNVVITVARKPLSEGTLAKNALKHGTGGLNIDGCKVGSTPSPSVDRRNHAAPGVSIGATGWTTQARPASYNEQKPGELLGRWPANLILVHLGGCRCTGGKVVANSGHYPKERGQGGLGTSGHGGQAGLQEVRENLETVTAWDCQPGCPVAALDGHSGVSRSPAPYVQRTLVKGDVYALGSLEDKLGRMSTEHGDSGGASRFFKQVQAKDGEPQ